MSFGPHFSLRVVVAMACDVQDEWFLTYGLLKVLESSEYTLKLNTFPGVSNRFLDTLVLATKVQWIHLISFFVFAFNPLGWGVQEHNIDAATVVGAMEFQFSLQIFNLSSLLIYCSFTLFYLLFLLVQSFLLLTDGTHRVASQGIHRFRSMDSICLRFFRHADIRSKYSTGSRSADAWCLFWSSICCVCCILYDLILPWIRIGRTTAWLSM